MAGTNQSMFVRPSEIFNGRMNESSMNSLGSDSRDKCPLCTESVPAHISILEHVRIAHKERLIAFCKVCRQPLSPGSIQEHTEKCKGSFACPHCCVSFAYLSQFHRHIRDKHDDATRPFCDICGKIFSSMSALSSHKKLHSGIVDYSCKFCAASFTQHCNLKFHMDSHHAYVELRDAPKPYKCETCGRGFMFACSLQHHRIQHNKFPKKFSCSFCTQQFSFRSELERHLTSHSNLAKNQCPFCLRSFRRSTLLKSHMRLHLDPNPLTCRYCLRTFASRAYLLIHMQQHASKIPSIQQQAASYGPLTLPENGELKLDSQMAPVHEALLDKYDDCLLEATVQPEVSLIHSILYAKPEEETPECKTTVSESRE